MIREEIRAITSSRRDLRNFGLVVGTGFAALGALLLWKGKDMWPWFVGAGLLLILLGAAAPSLLKPLQRAWMTLAVVMGWFMTRLILSLLFFLVLVPIGLVGRLAGKKFLASPAGENDSYWIRRSRDDQDARRLEKQF
jgi:uncharacterized membrane protein